METAMTCTVLIIEDDPDAARLVELYLSRDGHKVLSASDGREGLRLARETKPDLVLLDLMLPGMDGLEICRTLRKESTAPIVMVTARVEERDRIDGLDMGADDYVSKPFSPAELMARVRAVLRRTAWESLERGAEEFGHGDITINSRQHLARVGGQPVALTPTEFRILSLLVGQPQRTFTRDEIIERVFGYDFDGFDRTVDSHVANLRRKLGAGGGSGERIKTVYGIGYRLGDV